VRALLDLALGLVAPPPPPGGRQQQQQQQEQEDAAFDCPGKRTPFSLLEDVFEVLGVAQVEVRRCAWGGVGWMWWIRLGTDPWSIDRWTDIVVVVVVS